MSESVMDKKKVIKKNNQQLKKNFPINAPFAYKGHLKYCVECPKVYRPLVLPHMLQN